MTDGEPEPGHGGARPLQEQLQRLVGGERSQLDTVLAGHVEGLPAGGQHTDALGLAQQNVGQHGAGVDEMLTGVEHDQQPTPLKMGDHGVDRRHPGLLGQFEHGGERRGDEFRVAQPGQLGQPHPVGEQLPEPGGGPQSGTALADAARPDERDEPSLLERAPHQREFLGPPDKTGQLDGQLPTPPLPEPEHHPRPLLPPTAHGTGYVGERGA